MTDRKKSLENLINKYKDYRLRNIDADISEATIRSWINELLEIFGWDTKDTSSIIQEKQLSKKEKEKLKEIESNSNRPDYKLVVNGKDVTFLDAKNISVDIEHCKNSAFQIKSYGWSASSPCTFLTNFDEFAIYDTTYIPSIEQEANFGRIYLKIDEYLENFALLDKHLFKENVLAGQLQRMYDDESFKKHNMPRIHTDVAFAERLSSFRLSLGNAIIKDNEKVLKDNIELLSYLVQMIINRIIFIRVCEARGIEKDGLLLEFTEHGFWERFKHSSYNDFFEHYDGPLFDRDLRLNKLDINDAIFDELLNLFYYPSPYKFDVIPTTLFSNIYEIFLGKRLELDGDELIEKIKPEYSKTNGVVSTPQYLVRDLIKRTIVKSKVRKKSISEIFDIKVLDFACGSGAFVIEIFDYLESILIDKYKRDKEKGLEEYFYIDDEVVTLTIQGKRKLISSCIYGIDIDADAVEVTRMSLALKVVDNLLDFEDYESLGVYGYQILNKIGENIEYGNTLISNDIFEIYPELENKKYEKEVDLIKCFDWGVDGFEDIFENKGGFDYIVGNPPYVEAKHMTKDMPTMYKYIKSQYITAKKGKIDLLIPFIERGMSLLNTRGSMGVIVQNRFFKSEYGSSIREFLTSNKILSEVLTFDVNNIFKDRITYISSMVFNSEPTDNIYHKAISDDVYNLPQVLNQIPTSQDDSKKFNLIKPLSLGSEPWIFEAEELLSIIDQLKEHNTPFGTFAKVRVGIQVLLVKAYHIKVKEIDEKTGILKGESAIDDNIELEIGACRSLVPNERFYSFRKDVNNTYAIFPYDIIDGEKHPILFNDFCKRFPLAGKYLTKHKKVIQENITDKKYKRKDTQRWHLYTRESHLEENYSKVLIPMTSNDVYASVTMSEFYYCDNSNINYLDIPDKTEDNLYAIAAIFNSTIFSVLARAIANKQQNGYFKLNKQYLEPVLFPSYIFNSGNKLVKKLALIGKEIEEKQSMYHNLVPYKQKRLKKTLINLWEELDVVTAEAYKLTKTQFDYFINQGRNVDRLDSLETMI